MDLLLRAQLLHRATFDPNKVQFSKLLNIKTSGCPEDCGYCSQSAHHDSGLQASKLMDPAQVLEEAKAALAAGAIGDRLETLRNVEKAGMKVCCGGILGLGEEPLDRVEMLTVLANLPQHPERVPINMLIPIKGTRLAKAEPVDPISFVRTVALARILMPKSEIRLSAGRTAMTDEMQALCFFAGANSIFIGDTLLTASNPDRDKDQQLLRRLGMERAGPVEPPPSQAPLV